MVCSVERRVSFRRMGSLITFLAIFGTFLMAQQEKPSPTSEYQYRKDYAQVEGIMKETDAQKRGDALLAFVKEHPQSRMLPYVWSYIQQILVEKEKAGAWDKVFALHDAWLAILKDDASVEKSLMGAYFRAKKLDKAAEMGEQLYAQTKDKALLGDLLTLYQQLQSSDKYVATADRILHEFPIEQSYATAIQLWTIYAQKNDYKKASDYAEKVMTAFGDKVPQGMQEGAWNATRIQMLTYIGANTYAAKDYAKALEYYEKVVKLDNKNETGHYYVGMCKWRNQDLDGAMASLARAAVLDKTLSKKAQEYLEQIYKPRHNNTLDGLDQVLAKAKSELGIG